MRRGRQSTRRPGEGAFAWSLGVGHRDAALLGDVADEALGVDLDRAFLAVARHAEAEHGRPARERAHLQLGGDGFMEPCSAEHAVFGQTRASGPLNMACSGVFRPVRACSGVQTALLCMMLAVHII